MARQILHLAGDGPALAAMRGVCRQEYLAKYLPQRNHDLLMEIYRQAIERRAYMPHGGSVATA
jgi:hypothetical protein